jgi:hypothetical protein
MAGNATSRLLTLPTSLIRGLVHRVVQTAQQRLKRGDSSSIRVDVKIVGMVGGRYLTVSQHVTVPDGASPVQALAALVDAGAIDKSVYRKIKALRPPFFVAINEVKQEKRPHSIALRDGDVLAVMQLTAGG